MRRGMWARSPDQLYQASRRGVIKVSALDKLGVPEATTYRRCVPGGPWRRLLPGVVQLTNGEPTRRQLVEAALLYAGSGTLITGVECCRRHGLRRLPDDDRIHLLLPNDRKVHGRDFVIIERTTRMPEQWTRDGLPLAPTGRAVLDACRRMRDFDPVRALLAEAVQRGGQRPAWLLAELERGSQRGSAIPREVLKETLAGSRSVAESHAMRVWERTGLPPLRWNVEVRHTDGRYIATPDGWLDEVALAWEIDSYDYHFGKADYAKTIERNGRYAAAGVVLVQTLPTKLRTDPAAVAAQLVAAYEAAAARPRPPVVARGE
jgi:hypothetical protein